MPTYEYRCEKCGHEFEAFQTMTEPPVEKCPACAGKVQRLISGGAGFLFKGSGFYITDYRSKEYKAAAKKESGKKSDAKGKSPSTSTGQEKTKPSSESKSTSSKPSTKSA
jgi:putative FmdB family regulatory protein